MASMTVTKNPTPTNYFMDDVVVWWLGREWSDERSFEGWVRLSHELYGAAVYARAVGHDGDAEMLRDAGSLAMCRAFFVLVRAEDHQPQQQEINNMIGTIKSIYTGGRNWYRPLSHAHRHVQALRPARTRSRDERRAATPLAAGSRSDPRELSRAMGVGRRLLVFRCIAREAFALSPSNQVRGETT